MISIHIEPINRPEESIFFNELYYDFILNRTVIARLINISYTINLQDYMLYHIK